MAMIHFAKSRDILSFCKTQGIPDLRGRRKRNYTAGSPMRLGLPGYLTSAGYMLLSPLTTQLSSLRRMSHHKERGKLPVRWKGMQCTEYVSLKLGNMVTSTTQSEAAPVMWWPTASAGHGHQFIDARPVPVRIRICTCTYAHPSYILHTSLRVFAAIGGLRRWPCVYLENK